MSSIRRILINVCLMASSVAALMLAAAPGRAAPASGAGKDPGSIAPGTVITTKNWQQYRRFMPNGMQLLFEGKGSWKMPADVSMTVGPTIGHPLPAGYVEATRKYASKVAIAQLGDGGLILKNYVAGEPFPNPSPPHAGWKILANVWYRYLPHLIVHTPDGMGTFCLQDRYGNVACNQIIMVYRQMRHNTDPGVPMTTAGAGPRDYTEWTMVEEPEQLKYKASLTIFYQDLAKPEDMYAFVPELRRTLRINTSSRCAPEFGSDMTPDDRRYGFNGNITRFSAKLLGERRILALVNFNTQFGKFPSEYYMPLGWPKPSWGNWELRDVYVIDVRRIPSQSAGYCYGRRIMYVDKNSYGIFWQDLYDSDLKLWKVALNAPRARMVPGVGVQDVSGSSLTIIWNLKDRHATYLFDADPQGHDTVINEQVPAQFHNVERYCGPAGLGEIMR